jgi:hypothetical protein
VQFFLQLAMQFYSWEMLISEICEEFSICWENISGVQWRLVFGNFTSLKSRIALQVARKIAPCNMAFSQTSISRRARGKFPCLVETSRLTTFWIVNYALKHIVNFNYFLTAVKANYTFIYNRLIYVIKVNYYNLTTFCICEADILLSQTYRTVSLAIQRRAYIIEPI